MEANSSKVAANGTDDDGGSAARVRAWTSQASSHKRPAKEISKHEESVRIEDDGSKNIHQTKSRPKMDSVSEENLDVFSEDDRKPTGHSNSQHDYKAHKEEGYNKRELVDKPVKTMKKILSSFSTYKKDDDGRFDDDRRHGRDREDKRERVKEKYPTDYRSVKDRATEHKSSMDKEERTFRSDKRKRTPEADAKPKRDYRTESTSKNRRKDDNEKSKREHRSELSRKDADEKPKREYRSELIRKDADEKPKRDYRSEAFRKDARREENSGRFDRWELKLDEDGIVKDQRNHSSPESPFKSSSKINRRQSFTKALHERERNQRGGSRSASPKPKPRHSSRSKREHEKSPSSHHGDRNAREKPEKDRNRDWEKFEKDRTNSHVASDNQYRRFGGRGSGIGGYSPRRRRSDAAMKTPSPPPKSPDRERKKARAWDLAPPGVDSSMVAAMAAAHHATAHQAMVQQAAALASVAGVSSAATSAGFSVPTLSSSVFQHVSPAVTAVSLTQATRPLRRLYIGNVPSTVSEGELLEFINAAMLSANSNHLPGTRPCISCSVHVDKSYAYAEFLTPEDATTALALDGVTLHGITLKIKRPKDFVRPINDGLEISFSAIDMVSNVVVDSPRKVFVGGISSFVSSDKVKEIVTAFGQLKAYHWEVDTSRSPPAAFAFLEYVDPSVTLTACAGLNGMKLGNAILTAVQATPNSLSEEAVAAVPFYGVPEHAKPLLHPPTSILELQNVVTEEQLSSLPQEDLNEVMEDVRVECSRFGNVKSVCLLKSATEEFLTSFAWTQTNKVSFLGECMTKSKEQPRDSDGISLKAAEPSLKGGEDSMCSQFTNSSNASQSVYQNVDSNKSLEMGIVSSMPQTTEINSKSEATDEFSPRGNVDSSLSLKQIISEMPIVESQVIDENKATSCCVEKGAKGEEVSLPNHLARQSLGSLVSSEGYKSPAEAEAIGEICSTTERNESFMVDSQSLRLGRIYVEFSRKESACQAAHALHGRAYGDKNVSVSYFPQEIYQSKVWKRTP